MTSKHTKAGRKARRRAHHTQLAREAWGAYQGRLLRAWMHSVSAMCAEMASAAWMRRAVTEGLITYRGITMLGGAP